MLSVIEELRAIVLPEVNRDLQRWKKDPNLFDIQIRNLQDFTNGRAEEVRAAAQAYFGLNAEQMQRYFGR